MDDDTKNRIEAMEIRLGGIEKELNRCRFQWNKSLWLVVAFLTVLLMFLAVCGMLWCVWSDDAIVRVGPLQLYVTGCLAFLAFIVAWALNCVARKNYRTSWRLQEAHRHKQMFRDSMASVLSGGDGTGGLKGIDYRLAEMIIENLADDPSKHMFE